MRIEWSGSGVKLRGLRGRDRDVEELQFHGAKNGAYAIRAKLKELKVGNRVVEEASEICLERRQDKERKVAERKLSRAQQAKQGGA